MKPILTEDAGQYVRGYPYWPDIRLDYTSGDLDYVGKHNIANASTDNENWIIWKLTWTSSNLTRIEGPLTGSWNGRASLTWG